MPLEIVTVPCLADNYAFLAHDSMTKQTAVIDVPDATPILTTAENRGWAIDYILITHHHADHVSGVAEVLCTYPNAQVIGARDDAKRLPPLDRAVAEADIVSIGNEQGAVIDVSGHTIGHIAYHFATSNVVFTADSLMVMGCGRVFEGTMRQMWESLNKLAKFPPETLVCSGHEYALANAKFALTVDPKNDMLKHRVTQIEQIRERNEATVPSLLSIELATNPFLRTTDPSIQAHLGMAGADAAEVFAEIRRRKDRF